MWFVYILRCSDDTLYCGVTTDLTRRLAQHNGGEGMRGGARYTRARRPCTLIWSESHATRSSACRREYEIKSLDRASKLSLCDDYASVIV